VTMPQIARKWNTSRQIIRGVLQRNRVAIRRWCIRPPVQKVRVAFAHASPVRLAVQDAVGAPGDSAAVTPDRAEPYEPFPALEPGRCVGCGVALEPTQRVCDACDVAGL
jgi:hypothetical protein